MKKKYSIFSLIKNAFSSNEKWQKMWESPEPKKGYDVRCNSVHPAFVNTPILDPIKQAFGAEEAVAKLARQIPMNKIGDTDDVSYAILYLASDESKFMTGTEIVLDGGLSAM